MAKNSIIRHLAFCCVFHCEIVKCNLSLFAKVSENLQLPQKLWKLSIKLLEAAQAKKSRYKRRLQHNNETTPLLEASLLIIGGSRKGFEVRCFINLMNRQKRENPFWSCGSEKDNPLTTKEISWVDIAMPINFISWLNLFKPLYFAHWAMLFSIVQKTSSFKESTQMSFKPKSLYYGVWFISQNCGEIVWPRAKSTTQAKQAHDDFAHISETHVMMSRVIKVLGSQSAMTTCM